MMIYTLPLLLLHGEAWATMLAEALDACEAVGMKVLMDIEQITPPNASRHDLARDLGCFLPKSGSGLHSSQEWLSNIVCGQVANSTADWSSVIRVVDNVKEHPATLGYYICGACATSRLVATVPC